jgi:hypothetical protein
MPPIPLLEEPIPPVPPLELLLFDTSPLLDELLELVDVCDVPSEQLGRKATEARMARETEEVERRVFMRAHAP